MKEGMNMMYKYCEANKGIRTVKNLSNGEALEKRLDSFGALAAIAIVRRNFPTTLGAASKR
jgi:hypothetical protein